MILYPRGKDGLSEHVSIDLEWTSGTYASSYDHIHAQFVICMSTMSFPTNYTCRSKSPFQHAHFHHGADAHMDRQQALRFDSPKLKVNMALPNLANSIN